MDNIAKDWALLNGYQIDSWLGSGDFGQAFTTRCGKVVKVTTDQSEFISAAQIEKQQHENLLEVYQTDWFNNHGIIVMEQLETDRVDDVFNELSLALDELTINEADSEDLDGIDVSDEAHSLLLDLQQCIQQYQKHGINPMDVHENNIGINQKGNYVLYDQRDIIANPEATFKDIIERKDKQKMIDAVNAPKIAVEHNSYKLEFEESDFNIKMKGLMESALKRIGEQVTTINTYNNESTHPDLIFPNETSVNVYFTSNPDIFYGFGIENEESLLGIHAISTGEGILGETAFSEEHAVIVLINEQNYFEQKADTFLDEQAFLKLYLTTLTHELSHAHEFIAHSGGLTPMEVDNLYDSGDFEYDLFECSTGNNIIASFDGDSDMDNDDIVNTMEERVELKGRLMIDSLDIDKEINEFLNLHKQNNRPRNKLR